MEAEETIINYETYDAIRGYGAPCAYSLMKPYLEHQAEISFKAGTLQAYGIAGVMGKKNSEDSYKAGIQEGRREEQKRMTKALRKLHDTGWSLGEILEGEDTCGTD